DAAVRPLSLSHCSRLQINLVSLATFGRYNQRPILNPQRLDENQLNVLLELRINLIHEDRQIPELLVGPDIPRLNVGATTIVIRSNVSNALIDHRLDLCLSDALGKRQTRQRQRRCDKNENESRHKCKEPNETEIS